jgi:membrane protease YdiL (CAAX protease family)
MDSKSNKKQILIYLAFAFGISWATGLIIYLTGGLENSPSFAIPGAEINLAIILLTTGYMFGPALANILTRLITREGKMHLFIEPHFDKRRWIYYIAAWFLPGLLTIAGAVLFFLLFPQYFNSQLSTLSEMLASSGGNSSINPWLIALVQTLQALLISPILNAIPTFGEEFGWRAYLQPKLMPLGGRKAVLLTGVIWGVWHWPIILMGYNYGNDYFGAPILGPLAMVWFTLSLSVIFGWITIKSANVWPAVIAHGALNGIAALGLIFVNGTPSTLLGPAPVGFIGGMGLTAAALVLLLHPSALKPTS